MKTTSLRFAFFSLVLIFTVFLTPAARSQSPASSRVSARNCASLQGSVLDPDGRAVPGARVDLLAGLVPVQQRSSDANGRYSFQELPAGTYTLVANVAGFSVLSADVQLQPEDARTVDLHLQVSAVEEHVVVSASLGGALAPQLGSSVSVVTRQDLDDRAAQNAFEGLQGLSGIEVERTGRHGGDTSVFIRGGNSDYNLIMLDGIEINKFGGDFDFASIPADGVDRIEIARGPQSALYGSNAVAGLINIVSEHGDGPPHFSLLAEGGSFSTRRFAGGGSGLTGAFSWAFHLSRLDSGGVVANDNYRDQSAFVSLGYSRSPKRQFNFHFFGNANDAGSPGPYGSDPDHLFAGLDTVSRNKQNLFTYQASYSEQFTARLKQVLSVSVAPDRSFFHSPFGDSFERNLRIVAHTHGEFTVSPKNVFVYGFEYNREQIQDTFITASDGHAFVLPRGSFAYFAEDRWNPFTRLSLTAGLRVDNPRTASLPEDPKSGRPFLPSSSITKVDPRITAVYVLPDSGANDSFGATRLHGSFGTGIKAPNGFDLAFTNNPALKPEKSTSFDAGIEQRFWNDRAVFDVTYFYNRYKDQIVVLGGSLQNLSTFVSDNLANSRALGIENNLRLRPLRSLELSAQFTWLDSSILALNGASTVLAPFQVGQPLIRRPHESAGYNITWRHRRLMINTNGVIRGAVFDIEPNLGTFACTLGFTCFFRNKGYVLANAGFSYQLPAGLEIYGRLNDFLNQKYEEAFGFPSLHLNFLAGMKFRFPAR